MRRRNGLVAGKTDRHKRTDRHDTIGEMEFEARAFDQNQMPVYTRQLREFTGCDHIFDSRHSNRCSDEWQRTNSRVIP
jgi:hypothetical protein